MLRRLARVGASRSAAAVASVARAAPLAPAAPLLPAALFSASASRSALQTRAPAFSVSSSPLSPAVVRAAAAPFVSTPAPVAGAFAAAAATAAGAPTSDADAALAAADYTLDALLNAEQKQILSDIRSLLDGVPVLLTPLGLTPADAALLATARASLSELFLVVVVGEFNSGKSNFINALLGAQHCRTGILPTTETVQILRYGPPAAAGDSTSTAAAASDSSASASVSASGDRTIRTLHLPVEWLKQANLVDTPGTNAVLTEHQEITEKFVPSADLILFVTSVERPFSESEKQFLSRIAQWRKKVVVVLNKVDLIIPTLASAGLAHVAPTTHAHAAAAAAAPAPGTVVTAGDASSYASVLGFVAANAKTVLKEAPPVFGVSSRLALEGKLALTAASAAAAAAPGAAAMSPASAAAAAAQARALMVNSGFSDLERHVLSELADERKVALKLTNPISVAETVVSRYEASLRARASALAVDVETRDTLKAEIRDFTREATQDLETQLAKVDNVFLRMKAASAAYLNQRMRVQHMPSLLLDGKRLRNDYDAVVNAGVSAEVDGIVGTMASWLVHKAAKQAQGLAHVMQRSVGSPTFAPVPAPAAEPSSASTEASAAAAAAADAEAAGSALALIADPVSVSASSWATAAGAAAGAGAGAGSGAGLDLARQAEAVRAAGVDLHQSRAAVLADIQASVRTAVADSRRAAATSKMALTVQRAVVATAALEIGALSLSGLVAAAVLDMAGLAGAGTVALAGFVVLPSQRARLNKLLAGKIDALHAEVRSSLETQFTREIETAERALSLAVNPFYRFVGREEEKVRALTGQIDTTRTDMARIRRDIAAAAAAATASHAAADAGKVATKV